MEDKTRARLVIKGHVQGVWFRDSTRRKANELGIYGWVKNRHDGAVEVLAEGVYKDMKQFIDWCRKGPPQAIVRDMDITHDEWLGEFDSFDIVF